MTLNFMCGRYTLFEPNKLQERFDTDNEIDLEASYNITPGQTQPVIIPHEIKLMKWGLGFYKSINARSEGIETKPSFKKPLQSQRCLIPANGFYEWSKGPHYFKLKNISLFAFAGLYEASTYTIITTQANEIVAKIHDRMPIILEPELEKIWLDPEAKIEQVLSLLKPYPSGEIITYPVSLEVNNPHTNNSQLINPLNS